MSQTELDRTIKRATDNAHGTVNAASNAAEGIAQQVNDMAASVQKTARKVYDTAGDLGQEAMERGNRLSTTMADQIESRPMTALLIAATAAFFAGMLLTRR
jgi:ElaB/YqjD/DUF883 family membrane-anchored ribosome-binding protein